MAKKRQRKKPSAVNRKASSRRTAKAAAKAKRLENGLVTDRLQYLKNAANPRVNFKSKKEAEAFAKEIYKQTGAKYTVTGKTAKLESITKDSVRHSADFKRIQRDLRSRSKSAKGKKAKALEELGRRESFWNWAVGETNE